MTPTVAISWAQITRYRLTRHELTPERHGFDIVELSRRLGGLHSQVDRSGWLIGAVRSSATVRMEALWDTRELVRSWTCRGTLHLVPSADLHMWVSALSARERRLQRPPSWYRTHGCTPIQLATITEAVGEVLGAEPITREELVSRVLECLRAPDLAEALSSGWGVLFKPAAAHGLLISGPPVAGRATFVRPSDWLGRTLRTVDAEEATAELVRRFIDLNGVVCGKDLSAWWGESPAWARRWMTEHRDELVDVTVSGRSGFVSLARTVDALSSERPPISAPLILPMFDPFVLSPISHRAAMVPEQHAARVFRQAGWVSGTVVSGDAIAGTWTISGTSVVNVEVSLFDKMPATDRWRVEDAAVRALRLIGLEPSAVLIRC